MGIVMINTKKYTFSRLSSIKNNLFIKGIFTGLSLAYPGCILFVFLDYLGAVIESGFVQDPYIIIYTITIFIFFESLLLTFPVIINSALIVLVLKLYSKNHTPSKNTGWNVGSIIGSITGLWLCSLVWLFMILLTYHRFSIPAYILRTIEVLIISYLAGGMTGKIIALNLSKNSSLETNKQDA